MLMSTAQFPEPAGPDMDHSTTLPDPFLPLSLQERRDHERIFFYEIHLKTKKKSILSRFLERMKLLIAKTA